MTMYAIVDAELEVAHVTDAWRAFFGLDQDDVGGRSLACVTRDSDTVEVLRGLLAEGGSRALELTGAEGRTVRATAQTFDVAGVRAILVEGHARASGAHELADAHAVRRVRDEVRAAAHDLRSPLSTILIATKLLERRSECADEIGEIRRAVEKANRLIEGLLLETAVAERPSGPGLISAARAAERESEELGERIVRRRVRPTR